jgi:hypothetical protein
MEVPLLSAAAEGPYVDLRGFSATIGPEDTTYYLHEHGKAIPFKPRGVSVPDRCPRSGAGGYPVSATFTWWEGLEPSHVVTRVPCPKQAPTRDRVRAHRADRRTSVASSASGHDRVCAECGSTQSKLANSTGIDSQIKLAEVFGPPRGYWRRGLFVRSYR